MTFHLCVLNQLSTIFTVNPLELLACVGGLMLLHVLGRVEDLATIRTGVLLPKLVKICIKPRSYFSYESEVSTLWTIFL